MEYETKDSGARQEYESGMVRDTDEGKVRYDLALDGPMFERYAELMTRGAKKYGDRNWMKALGEEELARFRQAALRHFFQYLRGESDEDHAAAVVFNLNGAEYVKEKMVGVRPIAWAAGLFEGEGSIVTRPTRNSVQLTVYSTDKDTIDAFAAAVGVGSITGPRKPKQGINGGLAESYKEMWEWHAYSSNAHKVLEMFLPFLGERRRAKAQEALAITSTSRLSSRPEGPPAPETKLPLSEEFFSPNQQMSLCTYCQDPNCGGCTPDHPGA